MMQILEHLFSNLTCVRLQDCWCHFSQVILKLSELQRKGVWLKGLCQVQFILFNSANYWPSIAMKLKISKEITCNDKIRDPRQTNMSPEHYF